MALPASAASSALGLSHAFPVIGLGASAGGLEAYLELFENLPTNTGMAFVLVQHLAPNHLSMLAEIVKKRTEMKVQEITDGMNVEPNNVYIIPPKNVLEIFHGTLFLKPLAREQSTGILVDTFFSSLARDHGTLAVGVILSGTGSDGAQGLREIRAEGGISMVQDPATAKYDGMPRMAISLDHPDHVLPIKELARELVKVATNPRAGILLTQSPKLSPDDELILKKIYLLIRAQNRTDFTPYKLPTIIRRINRRMVLHRIHSLRKYYDFLQTNALETQSLFHDLLINVTSFFREPDTFEALKATVFPSIMKRHKEGQGIRIWVPGCSSGEEVYSIAIALLEFLGDKATHVPLQIYGTDISEPMIKKARAAQYPASIEKTVSAERLHRFFIRDGDYYRINRLVRDCCVFSVQDVISDPPIHRLNLLSCRNLMIYLEPDTQKKLMNTFFYALQPNGYLILGASEAVGTSASLFAMADKKRKIYVKRGVASHAKPMHSNSPVAAKSAFLIPEIPLMKKKSTPKPEDILVEAERYAYQELGLAALLVNQAMDIVHISGNAERYLALAPGEPSWNFTKIVRKDLIAEVRILLHRASKSKGFVQKLNVPYKFGRISASVDIRARMLGHASEQPHFLLLFNELPGKPRAKPAKGKAAPGKRGELERLKKELHESGQAVREIIAEQKAANDIYQNANEDILSANEELQSTNEELETAKEELQSTNEELTTLNEELSIRNSELAHASNDLNNVLNNANLPILMLGPDMEVRRFTPVASKLLHLVPGDVGRRLEDINTGFPIEVLEERVHEVMRTASSVELELANNKGRFFSLRIKPYKTIENKIDGAVIVFVDIELMKSKEAAARLAEQYSSAIVETVNIPLVILDKQLRIIKATGAFYDFFKTEAKDTIGRQLIEIGGGALNIRELKKLLEEILPQTAKVKDFEVSLELKGTKGTRSKTVLINAQVLEWEGQKELHILMSIREP